MRRLLPTLLDTLAVVFVIAALLLVVLPLSTSVPTAPPQLPSESATVAAAKSISPNSVDDQSTRIVAANLFSASRRAPRTPFVPPGQDDGALASFVSNVDATTESTVAPDVVLEGIVTHEGRALALIRITSSSTSIPAAGEEQTAESSASSPRLLGVGERIAISCAYIGSDHVVLTSGRSVPCDCIGRLIRLQRPAP